MPIYAALPAKCRSRHSNSAVTIFALSIGPRRASYPRCAACTRSAGHARQGGWRARPSCHDRERQARGMLRRKHLFLEQRRGRPGGLQRRAFEAGLSEGFWHAASTHGLPASAGHARLRRSRKVPTRREADGAPQPGRAVDAEVGLCCVSESRNPASRALDAPWSRPPPTPETRQQAASAAP